MLEYIGYGLSFVLAVVIIAQQIKISKDKTSDKINLSTEKTNLEAKIKILEEEKSELIEQNTTLSIENEGYSNLSSISLNDKEIINKLGLENETLNAKLIDFAARFQDSQDLIQSLNEKLLNNNDISVLNDKLFTAHAQLETVESELAVKSASLKSIQEVLTDKDFDLNKLNIINNEQQESISQLLENNKKLLSENESLQSAKHNLEQQIEKLISTPNVNIDTESAKGENRILLVDDSVVIRTKLGNLLKDNGFEVVLAKDGVEALEILSSDYNFGLVITDLEMPNLNGYELIAKTSNVIKDKVVPFLAITGHDEVTINVDDCFGLGGITKKPWNDSVILNKIKGLIAK